MRTVVYWGVYWGPLILGNYHICIYAYICTCTLNPRPETLITEPCDSGALEEHQSRNLRQNFRLRAFSVYNQDSPCTLDWGYMIPNSGYLGPNSG